MRGKFFFFCHTGKEDDPSFGARYHHVQPVGYKNPHHTIGNLEHNVDAKITNYSTSPAKNYREPLYSIT